MSRKAGQGEEEEVAPSQEAKREDASPPWREEDVGVTNLILSFRPYISVCTECSVLDIPQAEMGRLQRKSTYNSMKNKTSPESSPTPTSRPEHCNVEKAEENDLKNNLMKMIEEALKGKMKNAVKEIEEKTNKKLEEMNKEIEEKNKKIKEMNKEIEDKNKNGRKR
ncbi:hypothetical protein STEG23_014627 [Scotinomys teguina]